jgi:AI-2 transport protein TqsA
MAAGDEPPSTLPRGFVILVGGASAVILAAGVQALAWLVGPVFLAFVIVIVISPVGHRLRDRGVPGWAATAALVLLVYGVVLVLAAVLVVSVARLATVLPQYAAEADALVASGLAGLTAFGVGPEQVRALLSALDIGRVAAVVGGLLAGLAGLATNLIFLFSLMLFISLESAGAGARLAAITRNRPLVAESLSRFVSGTRRYLVVTTVFGFGLGVLDAAVLAVLGIPLAVLWGLLAFITNYIPYVGFWIGVTPPALLALLVGGPRLAVIIIVIYIVLNFVVTSLVQPHVIGDAVGLSVTVTFVALVLWGWLLGPVGAVLAVPLTLLVRAVLVDADPRAGWVAALVGSSSVVRRIGTADDASGP